MSPEYLPYNGESCDSPCLISMKSVASNEKLWNWKINKMYFQKNSQKLPMFVWLGLQCTFNNLSVIFWLTVNGWKKQQYWDRPYHMFLSGLQPFCMQLYSLWTHGIKVKSLSVWINGQSTFSILSRGFLVKKVRMAMS